MRIKLLEEKKKELKTTHKSTLLTKKQTAFELGDISTATLDRMRKDGLIKSKKIRGSIRFTLEEIAQHMV